PQVPPAHPNTVVPPGGQARDLRPPPTSGEVGTGIDDPEEEALEDRGLPTAFAAAAAGMVISAATLALARVWHDLNRPEPSLQRLRSGTAIWPTQFGSTDEPLAVLPVGMGLAYQKVLLPGESDAVRAGQVTTIRGLVHPLDQVRHLTGTKHLHRALGLGYSVLDQHGRTELAFDPNPDHLDVLRFNGIRDADLIVPIADDVEVDDRSGLEHQVRRHARPWQGGGTAPGSTLDQLIEEYEILGETGVAIPHLAEIWRIHASGDIEHLSTHNARTGVWSGDRVAMVQPTGRLAENGHFAVMPDESVFQAIALTEREHVLIARGPQAPEFFTEVGDGTHRFVVQNDQIDRIVGVKTMGTWQGARVTVLGRVRQNALVDYADPWPQQAARLGFSQLNQGQWQQRWVPMSEVADITEWEREYGRPRIESSIRPHVPSGGGSLVPAGGVGITS
ncbi:MAG: hypothetical protein L0G99_17675, partial [Propionibacteriales bacterium]|nr:hypothetical protein [Propionibacteriales bacterium]